ncbi:Peptidoglycan/LPS O-acetylase OafA/YrhL, contains acyltransferase and SGNH-hydrolase domains [Blastococcus aggregatus]|uniref:Peptidoglycan/LPS O-acetylase OafA/YrhL, contains acyltransferase and SGNH-hydrolase domains n=1 Tax=Blastococcus aggregatus TaxID=38502 RepID=A0A285V0Q9_9ACTN|nr:acyltransferase family protein [Blastococcus aggregatus]SOC47745.1 Peptidoglycan/LPS O-acetylase OafA/YrhL, contains acyltransferase and SGNH-hydrolase domains [Blastococcus aggregatus]
MGIRPEGAPRSNFRGDVEGLRAIAVGLVLLYHADSSLMPGGFIGVDIFFVISGFLITGLLLAEIETTGKISLVGFYGRRAKRLLPAAAVVLTTVAVLSVALLPEIRWTSIGGDIVASAFYVANWRFAQGAVDYLAQDAAASPVQHFWSLAVEEQFYLIWPLLLLAAVALSRRSGRRGRPSTRALMVGLGIVAVPSLVFSVYLTAADPGRAYFVTTTRMWELAVGAAIAILAVQIARIPRVIAAALAWAGLLTVLATGFLLTVEVPFPGSIALVPTLGVAGVIAGGMSAGGLGPARVLGVAPLRLVGALSYSLYLWHWPLLIIAEGTWGELSLSESLAVVIFSALPAYLTYRMVENPLRRSKRLAAQPRRAVGFGALATLAMLNVGMLVVLAAPAVPERYVPSPAALAAAADDDTAPEIGAATLASVPRDDAAGAPTDQVESFVPAAVAARDDIPPVYDLGCHGDQQETKAEACTFGDEDGDFQVALVGDSHAAQWVSPLAQIATERGWSLRTYTKSACPFADVTVMAGQQPYDACATWNRNVQDELTGQAQPDMLITTNSSYLIANGGTSLGSVASAEALKAGLARSWQVVMSAGVRVVALADTPRPGIDIAECVSVNEEQLTKCAISRAEAMGDQAGVHREVAAAVPGVALIDLNDAICPTDSCAAVIGGALVYRDTNHLTDTYARSLAPRLLAELDRVMGSELPAAEGP